jgi:prevent-host-death family protein
MNNPIDLSNVFPISATAARLAQLITRARVQSKPIVITQKGYPAAVLMDVASYVYLAELAERAQGHRAAGAATLEILPFTPADREEAQG